MAWGFTYFDQFSMNRTLQSCVRETKLERENYKDTKQSQLPKSVFRGYIFQKLLLA